MIDIQNLSKVFRSGGTTHVALQKVNLKIDKGEFVSFVGPSGCGKSTLLNMIAGLIQPSEGSLLYEGEPVVGINQKVGYMTQKDTLLPWRTTEANISVPLEIRKISNAEKKEKVMRYIDMVNLRGFENHYPMQLSGGMRKRAALARTLIYDPDTILMDEPFGALDAQLKLVMQDELLRIWRETQKTIIFVTHDLGEAINLSDRVVVFGAKPGRIRMIKKIDLPRSRDVFKVRFHPHYGEIYEELWDVLEQDVGKGEVV